MKLPPIDILKHPVRGEQTGPSEYELRETVSVLTRTLSTFDIKAHIETEGIKPGPVVSCFRLTPQDAIARHLLSVHSDDIALALGRRGVRIVLRLPDSANVCIEVANEARAPVALREILESPALASNASPLSFALGKISEGVPLACDLAAIEHLLVAGAPPSGMAPFLQVAIASLLFRYHPIQVRLLLIDTNHAGLAVYDGIPHLVDPTTPGHARTITSVERGVAALDAVGQAVSEGKRPLGLLGAQDRAERSSSSADEGGVPKPRVLVLLTELADIMNVSGPIVESAIFAIAHKGAAVGVHLLVATGRPDLDVLTGMIKAVLPNRMAFRTASRVDSRRIMDDAGAELLLSRGDALYQARGIGPVRLQTPFISGQEIARLAAYLKAGESEA